MLYGKTLKYVFHVIFHPFDGFWDIRHENKGSLAAAFTFVALLVATLTIEKQETAFLFNMNRLSDLNVVVDIVTVLMVYVLWCIANWCTTSLMDGKGRLVDIFTAMGYAIFPIVLIRLPLVLFSYIITTDEGSFYTVFGTIAYIWAGILVFAGTLTIHQYSVKKTIVTILITIAGMGIIMFLGLLFFNVISQIITFVSTIYQEVRFR